MHWTVDTQETWSVHPINHQNNTECASEYVTLLHIKLPNLILFLTARDPNPNNNRAKATDPDIPPRKQ